MKNRLCLLLYKLKDLNKDDFSKQERTNLTKMIRRAISISKEEVIGKILLILINKINRFDNEEFNKKLFDDLSKGMKYFSDELEDSFLKMDKANEHLRAIKLNIKKISVDNELLLFYNSYLDIENILNEEFNFNHFVDNIFNIEDKKLNEYYEQNITDDFISKRIEFLEENKVNNLNNYPNQIIVFANYMKFIKNKYPKVYFLIFLDFISSRIYDKLIIHTPDKDDIIIFNSLIKNKINLNYILKQQSQMK